MERFKITANVLLSATIVPLTIFATEGKAKGRKIDHPNIIIIYPDDLGYGDLGVTGHPDIKTPYLDKMALEGVRLTNYYSPSPASTASRYGLLTGRYPIRSGFNWVLDPKSPRGIHPHEVTLAEALKERGYTTAIFGKWHLGSTKKEYLPLQNGFDEYVGFPYSNDMRPPHYPDIPLLSGNDTIEINPDQSILTELYTNKTVEFIRKHKKNKFFIYVPYAMPHTPLYPGKKFAGKSKRGTYGDAVEEIDWSVGQIISALKKEGLEDNTIVWFMSDNGPWVIQKENGGSAGLFRDGKGSTWEGGMRVPCFVQWPKHIKAHINEDIVSGLDVYTTCIAIAGGELPSDRVVDGRDISGLLLNRANPEHTPKDDIYFYYGINNRLMAVRKGSWKLHIQTYSQLRLDYFEGKLPLLFDIYTDPSEKYEISDKHPQIVTELLQLIEKHNTEVNTTGTFYND